MFIMRSVARRNELASCNSLTLLTSGSSYSSLGPSFIILFHSFSLFLPAALPRLFSKTERRLIRVFANRYVSAYVCLMRAWLQMKPICMCAPDGFKVAPRPQTDPSPQKVHLCPAVFTTNVTSASKRRVKTLSTRVWY